MDCSTPGFPVPHDLLEFAQIHVYWVNDVIQPSHPLSLPLLLPSVFPSIRVFSNELALHIRCPKYWSFSFSISPSSEYSPLRLSGLISLLSKGLSGVFSSTTVWRHQFFGVHDHWEDHNLDYRDTWQSNVSAFQHAVYGCHHFPAKKQSSFDFMAAVTIFSDFGAQVMLEPKKRKSVTTSPSTCQAVTYVCVCVCVCMYV